LLYWYKGTITDAAAADVGMGSGGGEEDDESSGPEVGCKALAAEALRMLTCWVQARPAAAVIVTLLGVLSGAA
jgi:hypothetical protein